MTFESVSWPKEFQTEVIIGRRVVAEASNAWLLFGTGLLAHLGLRRAVASYTRRVDF